MIVVRRKPLGDIRRMIEGHERVALVGCNTCAAVSLAGGAKEVESLATALHIADGGNGRERRFRTEVLQRQCEPEYVSQLDVEDLDAVGSLACGAGVALMAEMLGRPVYPVLDTLFIGAARGVASWREECAACGDCVLGETAGICPVARCAKGILNGPCGGMEAGMCEVDPRRPCAWVDIHARLESLGRISSIDTILPPKDHSRRSSCGTLDLWSEEEEEAS
ncbi:MAG: methylenetetrahydrofolate reductase C-terminal domain-containing protein [Coriobacteriia bacterium]|nr:methylenetetrahydrofolate reductase C-terminal domain-containing protein [Coriobacteriia bacterium]